MTSNRFAVAVHILSLLAINGDRRLTSEWIAGSVNTNPVVIRRMMSALSKAGIIRTSPGVPGASLTRQADEITLLDIYRAVAPEELFSIHEKPNPDCLVGRNIQSSLETAFAEAQLAMENKLAGMTLEQIATDIRSKA